jgi:hypothetical protein
MFNITDVPKVQELIARVFAIIEYDLDIHYNAHGDNFMGDHLLADKFDFGFLDDLKETCILGSNQRILPSVDYMKKAIAFIPAVDKKNATTNFQRMAKLLNETRAFAENITMDIGDNDLIGAVCHDLKHYEGLIMLRLLK